MLETEEVDDDYFTPVASTTLSNIFGSTSNRYMASENESLKYTSPKLAVAVPKAEDDTKITECTFSCALTAFVWSDNVYTPKGKLGFAIIKILKHNIHNMVLYDSNKTTLSSTAISSRLEATVKGNNYISYYDNIQKYWSLHGKEDDIKKILEILDILNVSIRKCETADENLPETTYENSLIPPIDYKYQVKKNICESDTESSLSKKTKESILNRMASMGQSVLPPQVLHTEKTSDSSDTNEIINPPKTRHKPVKTIAKRFITDRKDLIDTHKFIGSKLDQNIDNNSTQLFSLVNGQLVPVNSVSTSQSSVNDMSLFISEQRISNSEIRININRTHDKVDQILNKMNNLEASERNKMDSSFQIEIMQKLLNEYENKIKTYEKMVKERNTQSLNNADSSNDEMVNYKSKIKELKGIVEENSKEIANLNIKILETEKEKELNENRLLKEIKELKLTLVNKDEKFANTINNVDEQTHDLRESPEIISKIKTILNDVFRAIGANFKNGEVYTGETIKTILASKIKEATQKSLNDVN